MNADSQVSTPECNGNGSPGIGGGQPTSLAAAEWLEKVFAGGPAPEAARMLIAIARGSQMWAGEGWFGPAQSRYSWEWLAHRHGIDPGQALTEAQFRGPREWFARLDRNGDGRIVADDLDWSDRHPYVQQSYLANRLFRKINAKVDGRLTRDDLSAFFEKAAHGKDHLTSDDFRDFLLAGVSSTFLPGDAPTQEMLVRGMFCGELGSINEGPALGESAPDFSLQAHDGRQTIRLREQIGARPVVLVFGNVTCPPFRSLYSKVDELGRRYADRAVFLAVYTRESHPTNGWPLQSNCRAGVEVAQPRTFDERVSVAALCHSKLQCSIPLLVDEINDPVGRAYSGGPCRLYVIGYDGRVVFKSGRGPFGFKPDEMEQALIMALLEQGD